MNFSALPALSRVISPLSFQQLIDAYDTGNIADIFYRQSPYDMNKTIWQEVLEYLPRNFPCNLVIHNPDPARKILSLLGTNLSSNYGELANIESFLRVLTLFGVERDVLLPDA